ASASTSFGFRGRDLAVVRLGFGDGAPVLRERVLVVTRRDIARVGGEFSLPIAARDRVDSCPAACESGSHRMPGGRWSMWTLLALSMLGFAMIAVAAQFPPDVKEALQTAKQLYVATRRADGTTSAMAPIWFMFDGDAIYFTTERDSHKAKRIAKG